MFGHIFPVDDIFEIQIGRSALAALVDDGRNHHPIDRPEVIQIPVVADAGQHPGFDLEVQGVVLELEVVFHLVV